MKKSIFLITLFVFIVLVALVFAVQFGGSRVSTAARATVPIPIKPVANNSKIQFDWKLGNPYLLRGGDGNVFLDLQVTGKNVPGIRRKRMNLVLVIDRSGSMASENKLEQVKSAANAIVDNMNADDRLAVVIYDDSIQTLIPSSPVENKQQIRGLINELAPGGSTNLAGGLQQGMEEVTKHFNQAYVNRIVLLSDGLANVGITDPDQIAAEAKRIRENRVSVSTMGVGVDYNENLMANIADFSGGNYYYISRETDMAGIFRKEYNLLEKLAGTNARATFRLNRDVDVVDVAGFKWRASGRDLTIEVPDIYSGETKRILVQLKAPANAKAMIDLGQGSFTCTELDGDKPRAFARNFHPSIQVIEDRAVVQKNYDEKIQSKVASVTASKTMEEAYQKLEAGQSEEAKGLALRALGYLSPAAPEAAPQRSRYNDFLQTLNAPATAETTKDMLKKQKEADRNAQQSNPQ